MKWWDTPVHVSVGKPHFFAHPFGARGICVSSDLGRLFRRYISDLVFYSGLGRLYPIFRVLSRFVALFKALSSF